MLRINKRWLLVVLWTLAVTQLGLGQLGKGVVTGTVSDPTGAVIPNAQVALTNEATGTTATGAANNAGLYRFDFIDPGTYDLSVKAPGFSDYSVNKIIVTVGKPVTLDVAMKVVQAGQTVTVEAQGVQLVDTADAQISGLVDRNTIQNLPLEIRDATAFVNLQPGAVPDVFNGSTRGAAVNGMRGGMGNFMIDGTDNNDYGQGGRGHNTSGTIPGGIVSISPDAVQEFRVVTNNFSAEYGRQGGFVTDTVLRSGTNDLHGSLFEYNRNSSTTANDFFSDTAGLQDKLNRNQFGGSLGGPIVRDKMFVFGAVELQRLRQSTPITGTGIRQQFLNFVNTGGLASFLNTKFFVPNGLPPVDCSNPKNPGCTLGPIFQQLNGQFPLPISTAPVGPTDNFNSSSVFTTASGAPFAYPVPMFGPITYSGNTKLNENRGSVRYDYQISPNNTITAHYLMDQFNLFTTGNGGDFSNPLFNQDNPNRTQNASVGYTHVFSPSFLNEARMTFLRSSANFPRQDPNIPSIGTIDALTLGFGTSSAIPQHFTENTFQYQDNVSIFKGRHSFKFGGEYRRTRNGSVFAADQNGLFEFWDTEDLLTDGALGDFAGAGAFYDAEASINPSSSTPALPEYYRGYRANEWGGYVQDDFKVTNSLTLNLGLRYDYFGPPHNFRPNIDSNLYYGSPNSPLPASNNPYFPRTPYTAEIAGATFQIRNNEIWHKDLDNFGPRLGLAWDIFGNQKTVLRAGGGMFYDRMWNNLFENIRFNPPLFAFADLGFVANGVAGPISAPGVYAIPINIANWFGSASKPSPRHMDQNLETAYSEQANVDVQQQIFGGMLFDAAYIGTFGHKLLGVVDLNTFPGRRDKAPGISHSRINPTIGADNARGNYYNSNYHALQLRLEKRIAHGLEFSTNYTWSHALDYVSDAFNNRAGGDFRPEDTFDRQLEYGNADFDLRHRFIADFVWNLPVFKSNGLLGGWALNGIFEAQSGSPFTIYDNSVDSNLDGHFNDRGVYTGSGSPMNAVNRNVSPADGYLNASMFGPTTNNGVVPVDGLLARNIIEGPRYFNTDASLSKRFKLTERMGLTATVNGFNLWNHPNFIMVPLQTSQAGNIASSQFGKSQNTVQPNNTGTGGRVMQFGLRLDF